MIGSILKTSHKNCWMERILSSDTYSSSGSCCREFYQDIAQKSVVDFSNKDIKMYLGSLFEEGYLTPVQGVKIKNIPSWVHRGILVDELGQLETSYNNLMDRLYDTINDITSYKDWWRVAKDWADTLIIYNDERIRGRLDEKAFMSPDFLNESFKIGFL